MQGFSCINPNEFVIIREKCSCMLFFYQNLIKGIAKIEKMG